MIRYERFWIKTLKLYINIGKYKKNKNYSEFEDYGEINHDERAKYVNDDLTKLTIPNKLKNLDLNESRKDIDAISLYPSAMWDEKSVHLEIESGFAFKPHMNVYYKLLIFKHLVKIVMGAQI